MAAMYVNGSKRNEQFPQRPFHRCFLLRFGQFEQAVSEQKIFRNKNCLWRPCLLMDQDEMSNLHRGLSIDASYQVSDHLTMRFQRRFFRNRPIRNKNRLWWPCLLMDMRQNEQSLQRTFHRCFLPSFGSFGHVVSEKKIFRNRPIRNKNRLWWPCFLMELERNEYSLQRTAHKCFLPSFRSFGQAVSEENNF